MQTTLSHFQKGSAKGYRHIAEIRAWAEDVLAGQFERDMEAQSPKMSAEDWEAREDEEDEEYLASIGSDEGDENDDGNDGGTSEGEEQDESRSERDEEPRSKKQHLSQARTEINYVLVCPETPNRKRSWVMPKGWQAVKGKVWCQLIRMDEILSRS